MLADRAEDRALVERVLAGDERARRTLVATYERPVRRAIGFLAANRYPHAQPSDVEDAVQHTFLAIFANDAQVLASWQGSASLRTYLARISERIAGRHFTRLTRTRGRFRLALDAPLATDGDTPMVDRVADDEPRVDARLVEGEERERLRAAILAELSELGQLYYRALFIDDLSVAEIVAREGTNANNVYQWRNRIMRTAQEVLRANGYLVPRE